MREHNRCYLAEKDGARVEGRGQATRWMRLAWLRWGAHAGVVCKLGKSNRSGGCRLEGDWS